MTAEIQNHAPEIFKEIISAMKIKGHDLCFCGSGKKYKKCCEKNDAPVLFTEKAFENVLKYKYSQGGKVEKIPQGLFNEFSNASLDRYNCLYPNCNKKPVSCHSIPENILRSSFDKHCLESRPQDESVKSVFVKTLEPIS